MLNPNGANAMYLSSRSEKNINYVQRALANGRSVNLFKNNEMRTAWERVVIASQAELDTLLCNPDVSDVLIRLNGKDYFLVKLAGCL